MKKSYELSQPAKLRRVKSGDISLTEKVRSELSALQNKKVDLSDENAPEILNWENAVVGKFYRPVKKQITIRIDADVLEWFKQQSEKYQTLINMLCREYMKMHLLAKRRRRVK